MARADVSNKLSSDLETLPGTYLLMGEIAAEIRRTEPGSQAHTDLHAWRLRLETKAAEIVSALQHFLRDSESVTLSEKGE